MRTQYLFPFFGTLSAFSSYAENIKEKVSINLGEDLVELAIASTSYQNSPLGVPNAHNRQTFLVYQLLGKYEGTVAWLAVNPWTGDVWNMDECKLFVNPALQRAQAQIKTHFTPSERSQYGRFHNMKPYRMYDLEPCP